MNDLLDRADAPSPIRGMVLRRQAIIASEDLGDDERATRLLDAAEADAIAVSDRQLLGRVRSTRASLDLDRGRWDGLEARLQRRDLTARRDRRFLCRRRPDFTRRNACHPGPVRSRRRTLETRRRSEPFLVQAHTPRARTCLVLVDRGTDHVGCYPCRHDTRHGRALRRPRPHRSCNQDRRLRRPGQRRNDAGRRALRPDGRLGSRSRVVDGFGRARRTRHRVRSPRRPRRRPLVSR